MNCKVVLESIISGLRYYMKENHINVYVLGISGGIDSTLTAAICKIADVPLIGISLPCSTNKDCEVSTAYKVGTEFCKEFKEISIQGAFDAVSKLTDEASGMSETPISQGNIKARLRMITLYDIASKRGGIVLDTDNLTEHYLGFWTLKGDEGDFNPIGGLWKNQVYELARYVNETYFGGKSEALLKSIELEPTDGNGVSNSDLEQIAPGRTYDDVDSILLAITKVGYTKDVRQKYGDECVNMVERRHNNSEFKRKSRPFIVDLNNGNILEKNGKLYMRNKLDEQ